MRDHIAYTHTLLDTHCWVLTSGRPGSPHATTVSSVGSWFSCHHTRTYSANPSSRPPMSALLVGPCCPVRASPPYTLAMNALYEFGSEKMFDSVTALFGCTTVSVHANTAPARSTVAAAMTLLDLVFICRISLIEAFCMVATRTGPSARR